LNSNEYDTTKESTGLDKIADAISREALSYIVENAEIVIRERMEELENDYNSMIQQIITKAVELISINPESIITTTQLGMILQGIATSGGETAPGFRTSQTEIKREEEDNNYHSGGIG
jgi:hypothetical protein